MTETIMTDVVRKEHEQVTYIFAGKIYRLTATRWSEFWGYVYDVDVCEIKDGFTIMRQGNRQHQQDMMAIDFALYHGLELTPQNIYEPMGKTLSSIFGDFFKDMVVCFRKLENDMY